MPGAITEPTVLTVPIEAAVKQALRCSGFRDLHNLDVARVNGRIRVTGYVRTYYLKQQAQTIAMSILPDQDLQNEIRVS